jgi:sulfatase modifying factor 1
MAIVEPAGLRVQIYAEILPPRRALRPYRPGDMGILPIKSSPLIMNLLFFRLLALGLTLTAAVAAASGPPGMVWVPGGEFVMGTDDERSMPNERPAHRVHIDGFWMDATDVTNAEFAKFIAATGYKTVAERPVDWEELKKQLPTGTPRPPDDMLQPGSLVFTPPDHPVNLRDMNGWWTWTSGANWRHPQGPKSSIDSKDNLPVVQEAWEDALAYAKWAGKRLPTEAEWEFAARGGAAKNTRYWWGDIFRPDGKSMANTWDGDFPYRNIRTDGYVGVAPVRAFPPNGYGLYDMAGNVWQWTADLYRADTHALNLEASRKTNGCCMNPTGPTSTFDPGRPVQDNPERVTKGGSFLFKVS